MHDAARWRCLWQVAKFADERALAARRPYSVLQIPDNILITQGVNFLFAKALNVSVGPGWSLLDGYARIGVGDGVTAATATDTDLAGTNKWFQILDGPPVLVDNTLKFSATVAPADAAFAWDEFCIDFGNSGASSGATVNDRLLNHRSGAGAGTKPNTQAWIAQATVAIS